MTVTATVPRRETTEDRRAAIARAACELIVEKGMEGLRTRDIARRVGINIATLHYHVPTKEALIALVTETLKAEFRGQSLSRPRAHLPPWERLEHEFFDFHELQTDGRQLIALMSELTERSRRDETVRVVIEPLKRKWHEMLAAILADGRDDGSFRPDLDPEPAALMLIGALIQFSPCPDTSDAAFARLCAEIRRSLRNQTDTASED